MKVTQEIIDKEVQRISYLMYTPSPRYVLLDTKTYQDFVKQATPKERILLNPQATPENKLFRMCCTGNRWVDILEVNVDRDMFEVL